MSDMLIRKEEPSDTAAVDALLREAFWNLYRPGCDEHVAARKLRDHPDCVADLKLVGVVEGEVVAYLTCSKAVVEGHESCPVVAFGPICVASSLQGRGFGTKLINEAISLAREAGYKAVVLLGHPCYYSRFGWKSSKFYGLTDAEDGYPKGQMVLPLQPDGLAGVSGVVRFSSALEVSPEELAEVEKDLPSKEQFRTRSQEMFDMVVALQADDPYPEAFDSKAVGDRTAV
eukprot:TRINITY_DN43208_c0_g1_i1.p1 TRINITY_DN43208_c0_g1~~TRINITY_DN43208_c0_g1_i1.p1  ORF type:complete len:230 (+),score=45.38 TRINITY_DN43208_c0_g1_i1:125-814(+)